MSEKAKKIWIRKDVYDKLAAMCPNDVDRLAEELLIKIIRQVEHEPDFLFSKK